MPSIVSYRAPESSIKELPRKIIVSFSPSGLNSSDEIAVFFTGDDTSPISGISSRIDRRSSFFYFI